MNPRIALHFAKSTAYATHSPPWRLPYQSWNYDRCTFNSTLFIAIGNPSCLTRDVLAL